MFFDLNKPLSNNIYSNATKDFLKFFHLDIRRINNYLSKVDPKTIDQKGKEMALKLFKEASVNVPAYRAFLKEENLITKEVKSWDDFKNIPITSKSNYLGKHEISKYVWKGDLNKISLISVSSGSTGEPFFWPRGLSLEFETALEHELFLKYIFKVDKRRTLFIVGYAMGMYVAGVFTQNSVARVIEKGYPITLVSPGTDKDAILKIIRGIGKNYDQIIISAYPPFLKDLLDKGTLEKIDWKQYNIKFITGGEGLSEEYRSYIYKKLGQEDYFNSSMNTYGSADAAILGHETPLSILIRSIANKNPKIQKALFGENRTPSLQQYYPFFKYFEEIDGNLVLSTYGGIPLIRYSIGDNGGVISFDKMVSVFKEFDIDIYKETKKNFPEYTIWKLPFVYLFGRKDNTKIYYGANIYPEHIKNCLEKEEIIDIVTGKYFIDAQINRRKNQTLYLAVELGPNIKPTSLLKRTITSTIHSNLLGINSEYKNSSQTMNLTHPNVDLFEYGDPKYFKPSIKPKYVKRK